MRCVRATASKKSRSPKRDHKGKSQQKGNALNHLDDLMNDLNITGAFSEAPAAAAAAGASSKEVCGRVVLVCLNRVSHAAAPFPVAQAVKPDALVAHPRVNLPRTGAKGTLLTAISGGGLHVEFEFARQPSIYGKDMVQFKKSIFKH